MRLQRSQGGSRVNVVPRPAAKEPENPFAHARNRGKLGLNFEGTHLMTWTTPRVIEIAVGMEINCYASASL
jgi:coenzyme PQQ precursor peptide PqqA